MAHSAGINSCRVPIYYTWVSRNNCGQKAVSKGIRAGWDLNPEPANYKSRAQTTTPQCSNVKYMYNNLLQMGQRERFTYHLNWQRWSFEWVKERVWAPLHLHPFLLPPPPPLRCVLSPNPSLAESQLATWCPVTMACLWVNKINLATNDYFLHDTGTLTFLW